MKIVLQKLAQININENELQIPKGNVDSNTFADVLELTFGLLGAIALIVIILSGIRFIMARGNSEAVARARNTIVYAAVGIILSVLSFAIVRLVVRGI
jgi:cytochrome bd-type quinol oxidase subunit 2